LWCVHTTHNIHLNPTYLHLDTRVNTHRSTNTKTHHQKDSLSLLEPMVMPTLLAVGHQPNRTLSRITCLSSSHLSLHLFVYIALVSFLFSLSLYIYVYIYIYFYHPVFFSFFFPLFFSGELKSEGGSLESSLARLDVSDKGTRVRVFRVWLVMFCSVLFWLVLDRQRRNRDEKKEKRREGKQRRT